MKIVKCLIVDDEPPAIRLLEKYVSKVPFLELIATTTSSLEALSKIEEGNIDLVFMDIQMPEMDGYQATKLIQERAISCVPKIIALTANATEEDRRKCIAAGMQDFISKPFQLERLVELLKKHGMGVVHA